GPHRGDPVGPERVDDEFELVLTHVRRRKVNASHLGSLSGLVVTASSAAAQATRMRSPRRAGPGRRLNRPRPWTTTRCGPPGATNVPPPSGAPPPTRPGPARMTPGATCTKRPTSQS